MQQGDAGPEGQGAQHDQPGQGEKRLGDHLANERTFLAWLRTGLSTITFGFVVAKFGLFLREMSQKNPAVPDRSGYFTAWIGILMTLLGAVAIVMSVINFLHTRRAIDRNQARPAITFSLFVAVLAGCIGVMLAIYLFITMFSL